MTLQRIAAILPRVKEASGLERSYRAQLLARQLPDPIMQFRFAKAAFSRQWRFDFAWPAFMLAVEIDGYVVRRIPGVGNVVMGGHATIDGIRSDIDKGNAAILLGWSVLHFEQGLVASGEAIDVTYRVLVAKGWNPT